MRKRESLFVTSSDSETELLGREIGKTLPQNAIIAFFGEFGAGKTTLIKGLASEASGISPHAINSPTFTYLNIYPGKKTIYHFDLYRLTYEDAFYQLGFDEYFNAAGICLIEWSERIQNRLPSPRIDVHITHSGEGKRQIRVIGIDA